MRDQTPARPLSELESLLSSSRRQLLEFVITRVDDRDLAEDILQDALVRAVAAIDGLRDEERVVPWFYRILRNAIVDSYRRRDVQRRRTEPLVDGDAFPDASDADERALCECFRALLSTLRPDYASLIEAVELGGEPAAAAAARLGITPNNLKVRRHRARQALGARLAETCRVCAEHGCLDCTCESAGGADRPARSL